MRDIELYIEQRSPLSGVGYFAAKEEEEASLSLVLLRRRKEAHHFVTFVLLDHQSALLIKDVHIQLRRNGTKRRRREWRLQLRGLDYSQGWT